MNLTVVTVQTTNCTGRHGVPHQLKVTTIIRPPQQARSTCLITCTMHASTVKYNSYRNFPAQHHFQQKLITYKENFTFTVPHSVQYEHNLSCKLPNECEVHCYNIRDNIKTTNSFKWPLIQVNLGESASETYNCSSAHGITINYCHSHHYPRRSCSASAWILFSLWMYVCMYVSALERKRLIGMT